MAKFRKHAPVISLCGSGGTGKSYFLGKLLERYGPDQILAAPSFTRMAYEEFGVPTEKVMRKMTPKERTEIQVFIFHFVRSAMREFVNQAPPGIKLIVLQRALHDHMAHLTVEGEREFYTHSTFEDLICSFYKAMMESGSAEIVYFPFPAPWYGAKTDDGFRSVDRSKDTNIDLEIITQMSRVRRCMPNPIPVIQLVSFDVEDRIHQVVTYHKDLVPLPIPAQPPASDPVSALASPDTV